VVGRAATMRWWQQVVKIAATTHLMWWRRDGEPPGAAMARGWCRGVYMARGRTRREASTALTVAAAALAQAARSGDEGTKLLAVGSKET
jgi:hypothetical protein